MDCLKVSFLQTIAIIFLLIVIEHCLIFNVLEVSPECIPDEYYIVVLRDDIVNSQDIADEMKLSFEYGGFELGNVYQNALKGFSACIPEAIYQDVLQNQSVDYIEKDKYMCVEYNEYDSLSSPLFKQELSTGLMRTELDLYMDINGGDKRIDAGIAIIDTGIDLDHPDLNVCGSQCFVPGTESGDDDIGHGTHMAGIAAALDNEIGVVGMAPGARLYAIKVLEEDIPGRARGKLSWVIAAVDWVTTAKDLEMIDVANMGMVGRGNSEALRKAIQNSINKGVVYVVASGDSSEEIYGYSLEDPNYDFIPAAFPEVSTISAMADFDGNWGGIGGSMGIEFKNIIYDIHDDTMVQFSNYSSYEHPENQILWPDAFDIGAVINGAAIDLAAPGVNILSTYLGGKYKKMSGTSTASAHVAGLMALYIAKRYGKANCADDVIEIREDFIYNSEPQCLWIPLADQNFCVFGDTLTNDSDWNLEGLVNAKFITDSPEVEIINPINYEEVQGKILIIARITSNDLLERVEYSIEGGKYYQMKHKVDNNGANRYEIKWNTKKKKNGDCKITVRAVTTTGWIGNDTVFADIDNEDEDECEELTLPQWWIPVFWPFCQGPECNVAMGAPVYGSIALRSPDLPDYMYEYDEIYGPYSNMPPYLGSYYPGQPPPYWGPSPDLGFYSNSAPTMGPPDLRFPNFGRFNLDPPPPSGYAGYAPPSIGPQYPGPQGFGPSYLGPPPPSGYAGYAPPSIGPQYPGPQGFGPAYLGPPPPSGYAGYAPPSIGPQYPGPQGFGPPYLGPPPPFGYAGYAPPSIGPQYPGPPSFGLPNLGAPPNYAPPSTGPRYPGPPGFGSPTVRQPIVPLL